MKRSTRISTRAAATVVIAAFLFAANTTPVAAQPRSVSGGPAPTPMEYHAVGDWTVSPGGGLVVVTMQCAPFTHAQDSSLIADAELSLSPLNLSGSLTGAVLSPSGSTDHASGEETAMVSASVSGSGVASFQVEARITPTSDTAAGAYSTTVAATLSAP